ncbi:hypothetical protein [Streptomyces sp. NPDC127066]|uniref:hypothetical protein n=1 Tax=Streptomyces sp. NPDC127066 TaxID=3347125 RepID=UPI00365FAB91
MTDTARGATASGRPDDRLPSVLRFATEIVAWVATPWVLSDRSWLLAVASVVLLIGLPTVFATPGDKSDVLVPVPGWVTVLLVLLQLVAAVVFSWLAWPGWAAGAVTLLAVATCVTERRRWQWLCRTGSARPAA